MTIAGHYDVIVLGAGAAGLMCALTAAERAKKVLVLEASNKPGKKILMSGGGRCNFTNLHTTADDFICTNPHFVKSALKQYTQWDFINWVAAEGIPYHEKTQGQLFCDNSAKQILKMLLDRCEQAGVEIKLTAETFAVENNFTLTTSQGRFATPALVVATGGLSIPTLGGATGLGYRLAQQFGLKVLPTSASLVPLTLSGRWRDFAISLSGVSLPVEVAVPAQSFAEDMLFTHRGLSGPAILQLSNYWTLGQEIEINLLPKVDLPEVLRQTKNTQPNSAISSVLYGLLPKSLCQALRKAYLEPDGEPEAMLQNYSSNELHDVAKKIQYWRLRPSGTEGYRTAEVTKAGVAVDQVSSKTMQVKSQPGLYFVGEVLDVTGHLGGYNFQWAWSSGYVAGSNV